VIEISAIMQALRSRKMPTHNAGGTGRFAKINESISLFDKLANNPFIAPFAYLFVGSFAAPSKTNINPKV
jgi:hypothetical protein